MAEDTQRESRIVVLIPECVLESSGELKKYRCLDPVPEIFIDLGWKVVDEHEYFCRLCIGDMNVQPRLEATSLGPQLIQPRVATCAVYRKR